MTYTKKQFGAELILLLEKNKYDIDFISKWADSIFLRELNNIRDEDLKGLIYEIGCMSSNPQIQLNKKELQDLAIKIIKEAN